MLNTKTWWNVYIYSDMNICVFKYFMSDDDTLKDSNQVIGLHNGMIYMQPFVLHREALSDEFFHLYRSPGKPVDAFKLLRFVARMNRS